MTNLKDPHQVPAELAAVFMKIERDQHERLTQMANAFSQISPMIRQLLGDELTDSTQDLMDQVAQTKSMEDFFQLEPVPEKPALPPSEAAEKFARALTKELPGKTNAGVRKKLREAARAWAQEAPIDRSRTLRKAIEATSRGLALTASGRHAVDQALRQAR